jgi:glycosyltransferase involved in cell wall biosynthesis
MAVGGAQKVLLDQARWFHAQGHKVIVAFFYDRDNLHAKWQAAYPFPIHDLRGFKPGAGRLRNAFHLLGGSLRCWSLMRGERVNAVETFTHDSNLLGIPLAWLSGIPVRIATFHGVIEGSSSWCKRLHACLINSRITTVLVAVSERVREIAVGEGIQPGNIVVIPNGIEIQDAVISPLHLRQDLGLPQDAPILLSVGRLTDQKGHDILIAAMPAVLAERANVMLVIVGDGPLHSALEQQVARLGLGGHVRLLGNRNDVRELLSLADIFVLPSRSEGLPLALLEAMGAGLPVIATRIAGAEEVVQEGENGLLVPPENHQALSQALLRLLADPSACRTMGRNGRELVKECYTLNRMCEAYLDLMNRPRIFI